MATLHVQDRLQPALLDRLTDDAPQDHHETTESRVIGRQRLRELVLRDLTWLFNTTSMVDDVDWTGLAEARNSVLNYGIPALSGKTASTVDPLVIQARIRQAVIDFEPRILPESLKVEAVITELQLDHHNQIGFRIAGQLWAQPMPLELMLQTDFDLETGRVAVRDLVR